MTLISIEVSACYGKSMIAMEITGCFGNSIVAKEINGDIHVGKGKFMIQAALWVEAIQPQAYNFNKLNRGIQYNTHAIYQYTIQKLMPNI
jgi:hypothetical protein